MLLRRRLLQQVGMAASATLKDQYASSGSSIKDADKKTRSRTSLQVSLSTDKSGELCRLLSVFKPHNINISQVANRPRAYENKAPLRTIFLDVEAYIEDQNMKKVMAELRETFPNVVVAGSWVIPWYPTEPKDLDELDQSTLTAGEELQEDPENPHPGFHDEVYRARRREIVGLAKNYKTGDKIPIVNYTEEENRVWSVVYDHLTRLYPTHACQQYNYVFPLLLESGVLSRTQMPQLRDVSDFLNEATGFTVRPVTGLLTSRDFLNALAFRVFYSTQYIRHAAQPLYTPEPDMVHDIIGHLPLLSDPDFAKFTQTIGLASLGASDELLGKLAKVYWYSVEFGLCSEGGRCKAYGAGILSSSGELEYALSDKPERVPWNPTVASITPFPITKYQPRYFVAESFPDAQHKLEAWLSSQEKPLYTVYNSYSRCVQSYPKNTWHMLQEQMKRTNFTF
ncbi:putative Biopterin-dependent aromatic amino acid hydroxylase [Leishmania utingensis]|uniref:phenylalanine 4-monooxygenase n=1 Tax=Leishmania utingensis TaxID=653362 RepID=A0AAW3A8D4_9TRYP